MGQSLASGDEAFPIVTLADTGYGNLQFARGVHTWREQEPGWCAEPERRPEGDFDLVPIVGGEAATRTGETIASGLTDHLRASLGMTDVRFLFSFAGQGSKRLRELDKRHDDAKDSRAWRRTAGGYYKTCIDDVRRAKAQADRRGWDYSVTAITWMQGEKNNDYRLNDWSDPLDRPAFLDAYAADLIALKDDSNSDILAVTGQLQRVPVFTYQTWGTVSGQAQLLASDRDPEIFVVSPTYYLDSAINSVNPLSGRWGNWIHLTGESQRWLGEQFAKVIRRVTVEGEDWKPLRPLSAWVGADRSAVYVRYHVPRPPLVLDDTFLPRAAGMGFSITGGPAVVAARVAAPNTIELTLNSPLPNGAEYSVSYASEPCSQQIESFPCASRLVRVGTTWPNGEASYEVVLAGNSEVSPLPFLRAGAFYLRDKLTAPSVNGVIRSVEQTPDGEVVMKGEVRELYGGVTFREGQSLTALAVRPFGNVRDSDAEASIYHFSAGPRVGQPYPLWNWSVSFDDLAIDESP